MSITLGRSSFYYINLLFNFSLKRNSYFPSISPSISSHLSTCTIVAPNIFLLNYRRQCHISLHLIFCTSFSRIITSFLYERLSSHDDSACFSCQYDKGTLSLLSIMTTYSVYVLLMETETKNYYSVQLFEYLKYKLTHKNKLDKVAYKQDHTNTQNK